MRTYDRLDIMLDLETLGLSDEATIFQIGAVLFDIEKELVIDTFNKSLKFDISNTDINADAETLQWWTSNDERRVLMQEIQENGVESEEVLFHMFFHWLEKISLQCSELYIWGNGIGFDINKIKYHFGRFELEWSDIFQYYAERDVRTALDIGKFAGVFDSRKEFKQSMTLEDEVYHNALDDALIQTRMVMYVYRVLKEKGGKDE